MNAAAYKGQFSLGEDFSYCILKSTLQAKVRTT